MLEREFLPWAWLRETMRSERKDFSCWLLAMMHIRSLPRAAISSSCARLWAEGAARGGPALQHSGVLPNGIPWGAALQGLKPLPYQQDAEVIPLEAAPTPAPRPPQPRLAAVQLRWLLRRRAAPPPPSPLRRHLGSLSPPSGKFNCGLDVGLEA